MVLTTKGDLEITIFKVLVCLYTRMETILKEIGCRIKCMEKEYFIGKMGKNILVSSTMIINMDLEYLSGLTERSTKASGKTIMNMEKEKSFKLKKESNLSEEEFGQMAKGLNG